MSSLKHIAPELVSELAVALIGEQRPELAEQFGHAAIDRCTYSDEDDLGYVYLTRPTPSSPFTKLAAPVAETVSFYLECGLNVDVDHDGHLFGVEFIGRPDVAVKLRAANVL